MTALPHYRLRRISTDVWIILALFGLWLLFFWRLFTPIHADQASLKQGDFSGQFVTFAGYQYARFASGEIPLWNPYNNGGLPFIADTQAAVFYPARLITIALANVFGGWSYHALELEMTVHVLAYTLMMYAFVRRLTFGQHGTHFGGLVAALVGGYCGFMSGYPPLQLALLEASIWLPLALMGVHEATRFQDKFIPRWLILTGLALGLSWMAGHPQTSFFLTYLLLAHLGYRVYVQRWRWTDFIIGAAIFGLIAFGLAAVQLIPGVEYLLHTTRSGFGYDAQGNGFPFQDLAQPIFPGIVSQFSPLYVGFVALVLAIIAASRRISGALFWGIIALIALLWSFGANTIVFPALYNLLPGLRFFRGQERAAYLVVNSLAILAGLGAAHLINWNVLQDRAAALNIKKWLARVFFASFFVTALIFAGWLGYPAAYNHLIMPVSFALLVVAATTLIVPPMLLKKLPPPIVWLIPALIVIELFTINSDAPSTYDPLPPTEQISIAPPPPIEQILADPITPFRVDGQRGLTANYGSLYGVQDIRGISPLWLNSGWALIQSDLPVERTWELFAVRYVLTDWNELPAVSSIIATGTDFYGAFNLHQLENPRPFAQLMTQVWIVQNDAEAYNWLRDPSFPVRDTIILYHDPDLNSNSVSSQTYPATVTTFAAEHMAITTNAQSDTILSVALLQYPGWYATIDAQPAEILRAYGGLSALYVPAGDHLIEFVYNPLSYRVGAIIGLVAWATVLASAIWILKDKRSEA
jgi:hypothetical protein